MFYFGVDYYPEQWPDERWPEDARLMAEVGFNVVRLAEFAWAKMEPSEGKFDFDWLDRAIEILSARGIKIVLGTPTASPPPWLMTKQEDLFLVERNGIRQTYGLRREYCPSHPLYREHTAQIVHRMAEHFQDNPAVIGWQIDNELGERCYCSICRVEFHKWLQKRYGTLNVMNEKWGTVFWSHTYTDWSQIPLPLSTAHSHNPGLALDYRRFMSDTYRGYQKSQIDIIRRYCPHHFITHNLMGFGFDQLNYYDLAADLDHVSWNNYPRSQWNMQAEVDSSRAALAADTMRGLKRRNFWVTEQQAGSGGWEIVSVTPRPGESRLWAFQSIAHGADAILFFRWRTARFGTEQYWHGILDHDAIPGRRYHEIKRMGGEIKRAGDQIAGSTIKPTVAMILSYESRFAFEVQANNPQFSYAEYFHEFYRALYDRHVHVDVIEPSTDLSDYKLVVAPALHVVSEAIAENLKRFVESGGTLVLTLRSGVKDESNAVVNRRLPGLLAELCGVEVQEYDSLPADARNGLEFALPELATAQLPPARMWCDVLKLNGATMVARYTQDYYAGKPAITLNRFGKGQVVYVGAVGDATLYETLARWLLGLAGVRRILAAPRGVEVAERWQGQRRILFVLNHTERQQEITLDCCHQDLLGGTSLQGTVAIAPRDVLVLLKEETRG